MSVWQKEISKDKLNYLMQLATGSKNITAK
jgi:hypothetical protein